MSWTSVFGGGWMVLGSLMMLLFSGGLIVLAILALRAFTHSGSGGARVPGATAPIGDRALDILKERYARGEISSDQYEELHSDLMG